MPVQDPLFRILQKLRMAQSLRSLPEMIRYLHLIPEMHSVESVPDN